MGGRPSQDGAHRSGPPRGSHRGVEAVHGSPGVAQYSGTRGRRLLVRGAFPPKITLPPAAGTSAGLPRGPGAGRGTATANSKRSRVADTSSAGGALPQQRWQKTKKAACCSCSLFQQLKRRRGCLHSSCCSCSGSQGSLLWWQKRGAQWTPVAAVAANSSGGKKQPSREAVDQKKGVGWLGARSRGPRLLSP